MSTDFKKREEVFIIYIDKLKAEMLEQVENLILISNRKRYICPWCKQSVISSALLDNCLFADKCEYSWRGNNCCECLCGTNVGLEK